MSPRGDCLVRYARLDDCLAGADLRAPHYGEEARQFDRIADATRRRQWLAGRALARDLLREAFGFNQHDDVEIISRSESGLGMRPLIVANGCRLECGLSISHTSRGVLVALAPKSDFLLGVDLCDKVERFTPGFLRLWFTSVEQTWIAGDGRRAAMVWAIKEAVFKAVSQGAPWNPREIEVHPANNGGAHDSFRCDYRGETIEPFSLALRQIDGHTAAIVCLAADAEIRFSVPMDKSREQNAQSTSLDSIAANHRRLDLAHTDVLVTPVAYSPRWNST